MLEIYNINMMNDKSIDQPQQKQWNRVLFLVLFLIIAIVVSLAVLSYGLMLLSEDKTTSGVIVVSAGILIIMIAGIYARMYNMQTMKGFGIQDELSSLWVYKSGFYSFVATMYIMIFMMILLEAGSQIRTVFYFGWTVSIVVFLVLHSIVKRQDVS